MDYLIKSRIIVYSLAAGSWPFGENEHRVLTVNNELDGESSFSECRGEKRFQNPFPVFSAPSQKTLQALLKDVLNWTFKSQEFQLAA